MPVEEGKLAPGAQGLKGLKLPKKFLHFSRSKIVKLMNTSSGISTDNTVLLTNSPNQSQEKHYYKNV